MTKDFVEIVRPERIVLQHQQPMHSFVMTMTFTERSVGTELTWQMLFLPDSSNPALKEIIADANEQNFDRLEMFLERFTSVSSRLPEP